MGSLAISIGKSVGVQLGSLLKQINFTSSPIFSIAENESGAIGTVAVDVQNALFSIVTGLDGSAFSINENTGVLTPASAFNYEAPSDGLNPVLDDDGNAIPQEGGGFILDESGANDNVYYLVIQATKGSLVTTQTIAVTVTDVVELEPEITNYITELTTPLSEGQITKLNTLVRALKAATGSTSLSDAFDVFRVEGNETIETDSRNLAKRAHDATNLSCVFTQFEGVAGDGINGYTNSNFNPTTQGIRFQLNDCSVLFYSRTNAVSSVRDVGAWNSYATHAISIYARDASSRFFASLNSDSIGILLAGSQTDSTGLYIVTRPDANTIIGYRNKTKHIGTLASSGMPNFNIFEHSINNGGSPGGSGTKQHAIKGYGRCFSDAEVNGITDAIEAYMDSNGKGVIA